ncbi:hypothetical protein [Clostridium sp. AM58-1XD]|uniref:hypothetical protein n=1 Tax=Clostridium sp. AM58-1XD TaxID=2292307 RepID=UPI0011C15471|nr:hypothetical protein [Clostridium sp. AM58-1XD]
MKKFRRTAFAALCCTALLSIGGALVSSAQTDFRQPVRIFGPVSREGSRFIIDNQSSSSSLGDIVIHVSDETRILDSVTGFPMALDDIQDGENAYAYISPAMALSLPPQSSADMILANIPADFKVPDYLMVESLISTSEGYTLQAADGTVFHIPSDCTIIPYLTRQMVTLESLTKGRTCLVWSDSSNNANKIVLFNQPVAGTGNYGWQKENNSWYYYNSDGTTAKGWLSDEGSWYYLNPETGIMETGFLTIDGNTYYLNDDGRMMTSPRTFTPDENGVLH